VSAPEITDPGRLRTPQHPAADPWSVVHLIVSDLAAHGVKTRFGPEADFGAAAQAAAEILIALGVRPVVPDDTPPPHRPAGSRP